MIVNSMCITVLFYLNDEGLPMCVCVCVCECVCECVAKACFCYMNAVVMFEFVAQRTALYLDCRQ